MAQVHPRKSFKSTIRNSILVFSIGLVAIFSLAIYITLYFVGTQRTEQQNIQNNKAVAEQLQTQVQAYESFIDKNFVNPIAYQGLDVLKNQSALYELLYQFVNSQSIKSVFYIVSNEGETLFTNAITETPYASSDIFLSGIFRQLKRDPNTTITSLNKIQLENNYRTVYSIGRGIVQNGTVIGYILFDFLESNLNNLIQTINVDVIVITDEFENAIVSSNNTVLDTIGKFKPIIENNTTTSIKNEKHFIFISEILDGSLKVYTLSSQRFLDDFFISSIIFLIIFSLISTFVVWIVVKNYTDKKTYALDALISAIEKVQDGNLDIRVRIESGDEFEDVGVYFNRMLENLTDLIVENNELISRTNLSEIKRLQAQFNPHFLFNALESLKYLIRFDANKAEVFILRLAQLLRYSLKVEKEHVTLKDDIQYIKTYLDIQALRYGTRFSYALDIQDSTMDCEIPKLILQPIIENSFEHGDSDEALHIDIHGSEMDGELHILIKDNGKGIDMDNLDSINLMLASEDNTSDHLGLYNVHRRIQLEYGANFGLKLTSGLGKGLVVEIALPYVKRG